MQPMQNLINGVQIAAETLYEQMVHVDGVSIPATAEDPFLRFAKTQRLPESLAP
jgi:hypothetical protein